MLQIYAVPQTETGYTKAWKAANTTTGADSWAKDMFEGCGGGASINVTAGSTYYIEGGITVGEQQGALAYGTAGNATYTVTQDPTTPAFIDYKVLWKDSSGTFTATKPTGVEAEFGNENKTLTVSTDGTTPEAPELHAPTASP